MLCGNCKKWYKGIPSTWLADMSKDSVAVNSLVATKVDYGFCTVIDDVMFATEQCIASPEQIANAVPLE